MIAPWTKAAWVSSSSWHGPSAGSVAVSWYGVARPSGLSGFTGTISVQFGSAAAPGPPAAPAAPGGPAAPGVVVRVSRPFAPMAVAAMAPRATIARTVMTRIGYAAIQSAGPRPRP